MSSADIAILTASANVTRDIYQRYINPKASDKRIVRLGTISSLIIGCISLLFAWLNPDIMDILLITFTFLSAGLFIPTFFGFFWKRGSISAAFYSMTFSLLTVIVWYMGRSMGWGSIFNIDALWPGLGVSAVLFFAISVLRGQKAEEREKIQHFLS